MPDATGRPPVGTGLDRIAANEGPALSGRRTVLLTHPAAVTADFRPARAVLEASGARLCALFGPEHGVDGAAQDMEPVEDGRQGDLPVYSLYGADEDSLVPKPAMFHGAEVLVCDLVDVGARYYTYAWTVVLAAEAALALGIEVLVLDRPNPLGGLDAQVEGGAVAPGYESFVGLFDVATRHGMTIGELVTMAVTERRRADASGLSVLRCRGWERSTMADETGVPWVLPSPNMPTLDTATVYPGQCLLEGTNLSEGRGTTRPFEFCGAPFLDGRTLASWIAPDDTPGLVLRPAAFVPTFQKHARKRCGGLQLHVVDRRAVRSLRTTYAILAAARRYAPEAFGYRDEAYEFVRDRPAIDLLAGGPWLRRMLEDGATAADMEAFTEPQRRAFLERRRPYLLYPGSDL